jgi:hypothetical protein
MEVSGQLHAPAVLPLGKEALVSVDWGGWVDPKAGLDTLFKRRVSFYCQEFTHISKVVHPIS